MGYANEARILGFCSVRDKNRVYTYWDSDTEGAKNWYKNRKSDEFGVKLNIAWHQLVGIHYGTELMLQKKPLFLFDAVGVGKTAQAAGLILMRPFLIDYHAEHSRYPPDFGEFVLSRY